jgi:predicted TIM-barrel fold metal-dependent hydrolase
MRLLLILIILSFAVSAAERPITLDAHLHYYPEDDGFISKLPKPEPEYDIIDGLKFCNNCGEGIIDQLSYKEIVDKDHVKMAFLISPSFHIDQHAYSKSIPEWRRDLKYVPVMNKRVSDIIQKSPGKYIGLCGFNAEWEPDFSSQAVSSCMKLPGMKGLKIHSYLGLVTSPEKQKTLKTILDHNFKKGPGVILWHLKEESELDFLLSLLKDYPETKFVIAHSMYDPALVNKILEKEKSEGRFNNLYLETSAADPSKMKKSWSDFGMDRILYGSDNLIKSYDEQIKGDIFSSEELEQVLNINAQKILTYLGHPAVDDSDRSIKIDKKVSSTIMETKAGTSHQ